ncbi:hypothetical protein CBR_g12399 [Chara braunii]|uniref:Uncharacterized protein n=1 Tax=Chara braunii TaxID=69332 RepID=A0A388KS40_CHABU|nr:hypothetical protein CBR_g12399 [Chara braunii]|eukprot:GBG72832.1 hypothetical protein CBR_g12399 [Chara braunii]
MLAEGQVNVTLRGTTYKIIFKPWMTRAEFRDLRRREEENVFWVMALQSPLDDMPFIYAQIEKAIGKIIRTHLMDADPDRPALVNARFDIDPEARVNMKDVLWVETSKGDVLEIQLATAGTLKCSKCKQYFHSEQDCRRGARSRNQGAATGGASSQNQTQHTEGASSAKGMTQGQGYQGTLGLRLQTPMQPGPVRSHLGRGLDGTVPMAAQEGWVQLALGTSERWGQFWTRQNKQGSERYREGKAQAPRAHFEEYWVEVKEEAEEGSSNQRVQPEGQGHGVLANRGG